MQNTQNNKQYKGFDLVWVLVIVTITSIVSGLTTGVIVFNNNRLTSTITYADLSKDEDLNQFLEVYANITSEYYEDVDKSAMLQKAISAMMNYLGDDYTDYLNTQTTADLMQELEGKYKGIGVSINNSTKAILEVFDDTPASKAGILAGDIVIGVNGENAENMDGSEVVALIKKLTTNFTLQLERDGQEISVTLKNEEILAPNISYEVIEGTSIGYLSIQTFSATLDTQVKKALSSLESQGITSLIIDVRDNTGGYLDAAVSVANMFLEKGKKIYSLSNKDNTEHFYDETSEKRTYPIVVLINKETASASELLASALKYSYGATLVGETSYGKGKVQQTMKLENGSMVKYTSAYWLMPNGTCIDQVGIVPDYEIKKDEINNDIEEENEIIDMQLEKAIEVLQ